MLKKKKMEYQLTQLLVLRRESFVDKEGSIWPAAIKGYLEDTVQKISEISVNWALTITECVL